MSSERQLAMIDYLKEEFNGREVIGAEIGVFRGEGSEYILSHLNIKQLHLIDPYDYEDPAYRDLARPHLEGASKEAKERVAKYSKLVTWWRISSDDAFIKLLEICKGTPFLDFVYIDGNHYADYVRRDIENYTRLVVSKGWVGGHDYTNGDVWVGDAPFLLEGEPIQIEVQPVVDKFVAKNGYYLFVAGDTAFPDWWCQLP